MAERYGPVSKTTGRGFESFRSCHYSVEQPFRGLAKRMERLVDQWFSGGRHSCRPVVSQKPQWPNGSELVRAWLAELEHVEGRLPSTIESHDKYLGLWIDWMAAQGGAGSIQVVTRAEIARYLAHLGTPKSQGGRGVAPQTRKSAYGHIRAFFNWAERAGYVGSSPVPQIKINVPRKVKPPFTREHYERLLSICNPVRFIGARDILMVNLFASTGMRLQELAGLELADIDQEGHVILVRMGKGQRQRYTPLAKTAHAALVRYLRFRQKDAYPTLWLTEERKPISKDGLGGRMGDLWRRAGLKGVVPDRCHGWRRTAPQQMLKAGLSWKEMKDAVGWEGDAMPKRYLGWSDNHESASRFGRGFDPWAAR